MERQEKLMAIQERWQEKGYQKMTPIQALARPAILSGQSVYLQAATGSGKTLAYLLPLMQSVEANQQLQLLILAPSQELALQIAKVGRDWADIFGLKIQELVGGVNLKRQMEALKHKAEIMVATPGRLLQILEQSRKIKPHSIKFLVLDEADFLISQEHRADLLELHRRLPLDLQFVLVSATVDQDLLAEFQKETQEIQLIQAQGDTSQVQHHYIICHQRKKFDALRRLAHLPGMKALVFVKHIDEIDRAFDYLSEQGIACLRLYSQLHSTERKAALNQVHQGNFTFLLTTDLASRGLDIAEIPFVIHFDLATDLATYLHRSGRTGRMGQPGQVLSLVNEQEARDLQNILQPAKIDLIESIIYQGQLSRAAINSDPKDKGETDTNKSQPVKKLKRSPRQESAPPAPQKSKRKKERHKDRKNKGKPRKKDKASEG
ncbi:DEAD/DEAH box helicase [Ignavigranum ruoffiae]|uniref:DEAD/DEAH box helicase n=1 Tax=Ignavigranum ruoffiae TaxID=89093 RepID=UPI003B004B39